MTSTDVMPTRSPVEMLEIEHVTMCDDDECAGCWRDDVALCGKDLTDVAFTMPGDLVVPCVVCQVNE